jgi:hypothetical protein
MCVHTYRSTSTRLTETKKKKRRRRGYLSWPVVYRSQINTLSSFFFLFLSFFSLPLLDKGIDTPHDLVWVERARLIKLRELYIHMYVYIVNVMVGIIDVVHDRIA